MEQKEYNDNDNRPPRSLVNAMRFMLKASTVMAAVESGALRSPGPEG